MTVRISTTNPAVASNVPSSSWPSNWVGTLGQYGTNNLAGSGVYNNANELIPVKTGTNNITNLYIGFDRLQNPVSQLYTIPKPTLNSVKTIDSAAGLGNITWKDPEDGSNKGSFVVKSIAGMNNNVLFYDSNSNNLAESSEIITGYRAIANFNDQKLKMKFTAAGTSQASFTFGYIDDAGKSNPSPSTYTVRWVGLALPVELVYFTAVVNSENKVDLNWVTASESNSDYFQVERSANGQDFTPIGSHVPAAGSSETDRSYAMVDNEPLSGISYYRLKQVDMDGHFEYSEITSVMISSSPSDQASVKVFPTLITTPYVNVDVSGTDKPVIVSVFDNSGRKLLVTTVPPNANTRLDLSSIRGTGVYIISCEAVSNTSNTKVVFSVH